MKEKQTTEKKQINEFVDAFIQNPFSFMLGANFLQQMFSNPEVGDDPEFQEWLETQDELPNTAAELKQRIKSGKGNKMTPEQLEKLSPESQKALSQALSNLSPGLENKMKAAQQKKAMFAWGELKEDYVATKRAFVKTLESVGPSMADAGIKPKGAEQIKNLMQSSIEPGLQTVEELMKKMDAELTKQKKDDKGDKKINEEGPFGAEFLGAGSRTIDTDPTMVATLPEAEGNADEQNKEKEAQKTNLTPEEEKIKKVQEISKNALKKMLQATTFLKKSGGNVATLMKADAFGVGKQSAKWVELLSGAISEIEDSLNMASAKIEKSLLKKAETLKESVTRRQKFYESFGDFS